MRSIDFLMGRRMWVVRDVVVWGIAEDADLRYLASEVVEGSTRMMFGRAMVGGAAQDIRFDELIDHKSNRLPSEISSPRVLIRPRSAHVAYLTGEESKTGFRVVRNPGAPGPISVDFFIYETGLPPQEA